MSKAEYKRFGDYIREVNVRNRELKVTNLLGLSMSKQFRPSTSNIIGVDLSKYKVVNKNVFAFDPMSVIRVHKVPIAINNTDSPIIVSPAYVTFECIDVNILDPYYLMMWFQRDEFDRYADFKSDAAVRGGYDWTELCETMVHIPSITRQREIVEEYETLSRRIRQNEQMIQNLEDTAQALYHKMFVEGIDKENLPEGWRMGTVGDMFELQRGFDLPSQDRVNGEFPIYSSTGIAAYHNKYKVDAPCVVTGRSGTIGEVFYVDKKCWPLNTTLWVKDFKGTPSFFVYYKLKELELGKTISGFAAVPTLNRNDVHMMESIIPPKELLVEFENEMMVVHHHKTIIEQENSKLTELQTLLLAKMGQ